MNRRLPAPGLALFALAAVGAFSGAFDRSFWRFLLSHPESFDRSSAGFIFNDQIIPLLCVALGAIVCWSLGRRFAPDAPTAFGLGLGALACCTAVLGSFGMLNRGALIGLSSLSLLAAAVGLCKHRPTLHLKSKLMPLWKLGLIVPIAYTAFHALVLALTPPTGYDVTAYHLAIPRLYLRAGGIVSLPWLFHSRWPHLMEVFYSLPLALGCDRAAALIHVACCAALAWAVYAAAKKELDENAALLAAALFVCQPVLHYVMSDAHSDGALALFHFLAALALWRWTKTQARGLLIASAFLSGCGAACKLQGVVLTLCLAFMARRKRADALLFLGLSAVIFGPWYLKTWLATGNPIWPFVFGGSDHAARLAADLNAFNGWQFPRDFPLFLRYGPHFILAPLIVLLIVVGRDRRLSPFVRFMLAPALPLALASCPSHEVWRYLLPIVPALALASAWLALTLIQRGGWRKTTALAAVVFALSPVLTLSQSNELFYVAGIKSTQDPGASARVHYLARATPYYSFYKDAARLLGPHDKVLLLRDVRGYHLDADYEWFEPLLQYDLEGRADIIAALRERGFTYAVVHDEPGWFNSFTPYSDETGGRVQRAMKRGGKRILQNGVYSLYALP